MKYIYTRVVFIMLMLVLDVFFSTGFLLNRLLSVTIRAFLCHLKFLDKESFDSYFFKKGLKKSAFRFMVSFCSFDIFLLLVLSSGFLAKVAEQKSTLLEWTVKVYLTILTQKSHHHAGLEIRTGVVSR